jgi:hypothetical protein
LMRMIPELLLADIWAFCNLRKKEAVSLSSDEMACGR